MSLSDELRSVLGDFIRVIEEAERNGSFGSASGGSETSTSRRSYRRNGESHKDWVNRRFEEISNPSWGGHREIYKKELEEIKKSREELEKKLEVDKDNIELKEKAIELDERQSDVEGKLRQYSKINQLKQISTHVKNIGGAFNSLLEPWAKINQAASNYARSVGMSVTGMKNLQKETQKAVNARSIALKYNMGSDELLKAQQDYLKGAGRSIRISADEQEDLAATHSVMQGREGEFFVQYEKFGKNISSTAEHLHDMFQTASREGISFEKYSDNVAKNIRLAQTYTFRNGLKGLEDMAKKATAIRLDMQQVANFADRVSTVEGAITTGAKLQVLGGPFAQFADPLGMLSEGLTDLEALQDRMVNMYGSLGQMNKQTGEIEISAYNKQRIKAAAQAMGVDPTAMMDSIFAKTRQNEIEAQINANANARGLDSNMRELIKNAGTFQEGKAGVTIDGQFKTLDELTNEDYGALRAETNDESDNIRDLAVSMRSFNEMKSGFSKQTAEYQAWALKWLGAAAIGIGSIVPLMIAIAGVVTAGNIGGGVMQMGENLRDIFKMFKGGKGVRNAKAALLKGGRKIGRAFSKPVGWVKDALGRATTRSVGMTSNAITKGGGSIGKAVTSISGSIKGGVSKVGTKIAGSTVGKAYAKLPKWAKATPKGMGVGMVAGLAGAGVDMLTDNLVEKGKIRKGSGGHYALKAGSGALQGLGYGAIFGPVGMAIGAAIGGAINAYSTHRKLLREERNKGLDNILAAKGIEKKGDYNARQLGLIDKALATGEISHRMRRKLSAQGDMAILDEINRVKEANEEKMSKRMEKLGVMKTKIGTANISVGVANFKGAGFEKVSSIRGNGLLGNGSNLIRGTAENGKSGGWEKVKETSAYDRARAKAAMDAANTPKAFDININGSLKLTGDNGQSVDIITELRKNPQLLRSLADMISKEISYINKGTNVVQRG